MTDELRKEMIAKILATPGAIGCDTDGKLLSIGDSVKVMQESSLRKGNSNYEFCSEGKTGVIVGKQGDEKAQDHWFVQVEFDKDGNKEIVGCVDINLKKLGP